MDLDIRTQLEGWNIPTILTRVSWKKGCQSMKRRLRPRSLSKRCGPRSGLDYCSLSKLLRRVRDHLSHAESWHVCLMIR